MQTPVRSLISIVRGLVRTPGFAVIAILTLGMGIGANTAIFSIVNALLLRSLPYDRPDHLVLVWGTTPKVKRASISSPNFLDYQDQNHVFEKMATFNGTDYILTGVIDPERVHGARITPDFFSILGVQPIYGRDFRAEEGQAGQTDVVILSYGFWRRRFAGNQSVLGRTITLNSKPYTIIGVMPETFEFSVSGYFRQAEIWSPAALVRDDKQRGRNYLRTLARLKPGVTIQQAKSDLNTISSQLARLYPATDEGLGVDIVFLHDQMTEGTRRPLLFLLGAVGFVLLIACANVANLQLERAVLRQKEIAIRVALGARHTRIAGELLAESIVVALAAGIVGVMLAIAGLATLRANFANVLSVGGEHVLDLKILSFTAIICILSAIFFGMAPIFQRSESLLKPLAENTRSAPMSHSRTYFRDLLVVAEFTLSFVLLVGAGLMVQSFVRALKVPLGFETKNLIVTSCDLPSYSYFDGPKQAVFFQNAIDSLRSLPSVEAVGAIDDLPLTPDRDSETLLIEGYSQDSQSGLPVAQVRSISPEYFKAAQVPLLSGRTFIANDSENAQAVTIINQTLARRFFPNQDPLRKRLKFASDSSVPWLTIVGVVGDVRDLGVEVIPEAEIYRPFWQAPFPYMNLVVHTANDPGSLSAAIRQTLHSLDSNLPVFPTQTMESVLASAIASRRLNTFLVGVFAAFALVLAMVGIYSVVAYSVVQRTHEIGIRVAMGAQKTQILYMILRYGTGLCLAGVVLGFILAMALGRLMSSLLFEVKFTDFYTLTTVSLVLIITPLVACYLPARRATNIEPLAALRT